MIGFLCEKSLQVKFLPTDHTLYCLLAKGFVPLKEVEGKKERKKTLGTPHN